MHELRCLYYDIQLYWEKQPKKGLEIGACMMGRGIGAGNKVRGFRISATEWEYLKKIGGGNATRGLTILVDQARLVTVESMDAVEEDAAGITPPMVKSKLVKCPNPGCEREWDYTGNKKHPAYVGCPDCLRRVQLPPEPDEESA